MKMKAALANQMKNDEPMIFEFQERNISEDM